jgi:hypothetical protein
MMRRHRWSTVWVVLALVACDEPMDGDAGVDARVVEDDGGTESDGGSGDAGTTDGGPATAPAVTAAAPSSIARGATLVITGTDLDGATGVTIGGTEQTIGANTDESITLDAVAVATPTGDQDLVVTTAGGSSTAVTVTVLEALGVTGAAATSTTRVTVTFSRELDAASVAAADFTIDGLTVTDASASAGTVTLTTDAQTAGTAYTVEVADVADTFGNALTGASSAAFTGFSEDAPTIITISAGQVVREISTLTITGTDLGGGTVTIGGTTQPITSNTATEIVAGPIVVATALGTQPVIVTTGGGSSGSMNVEVLERFRMVTLPAPTATSATEVTVTFNREVDAATVDASRFTIAGLTISAAAASGSTVTLTTSAQTVDATYTVSADAAVLDTLGTPVTADTVTFTGFRPPPPSEFIVVRVGDGTTVPAVAAEAVPVFLERRAIAGGAVISTVALPTTASGANLPFTLGYSGFTANSDGALSRSEDGTLLALTGYQSAPGTAAPRSDSAPRVVAVIDAADFGATPSIDTSTSLGTAFNTTSPRGAVIDGTTIWAVGGFGGVWTVTLGGTAPTQIVTPISMMPEPPSSGRAIAIFDGQLYYSSGGGTVPNQLNQIGTGLPTASGTTTTLVYASSSPYSFTGFDLDAAEPGLDTFYQANSTSGLERWEKVGGTWTLTATFTPAVFQSTCFEDATDVVCIASSATTLYSLRDVGGTSASTAMTMLAARAANTEFRGVAIPPVP